MSHPEKNANAFLRGALQTGDRMDRIENSLLVPGMPDVNGCFVGWEFWIESKAPSEPKRPETPLFGSNHKLSQDQKNWMLRQTNAGGNVFVYVQTENWRILVPAWFAEHLNEAPLQNILGNAEWREKKRGASATNMRIAIINSCRRNAKHP